MKENQAGSYKACYHLPLFLNNHSAAKKHSLSCRDIYVKKRGIGKKLILTIRAVMLDENVDLVARDFKRCVPSKKPVPTAPRRCVPAPGNGAGVCGFLEPTDCGSHVKRVLKVTVEP